MKELLTTAKDAVSGIDMILDALENGFHAEAKLHAQQHHAALSSAVRLAEEKAKAYADWQAQFRALGEEYRRLKGVKT